MHLAPGKQVKSSGGVSDWGGARSRANQEAPLGLQLGVTGRRFWGMSQVTGGQLSSLTTVHLGSHFCPWTEGLTVQSLIQLPVVPFILSKTGKDQSWGAQGAPWALASALRRDGYLSAGHPFIPHPGRGTGTLDCTGSGLSS